ncbi:MAG: KilA-N domain-containing protein [Comamonas sp.]
MAQSALVLHLDNISIRQLDGLFSLNDLHVAAGNSHGHRPGEFVRNQRTQELIAEITNAGISAIEPNAGLTGELTSAVSW